MTKLFAARTLNMLGMAFAPVALAFGILNLPTGSPRMLSTVLAAEAIPLVVFLLLGGVIADRYPRQLMLFASQTLAFIAYAALAWLIGHHVASLPILCTAAALSGLGGALGWPALTGLIPEIVARDRLQTGNALLSFGAALARILGVVAGGLVTALVGGAWGLALSALMYGVTAVLALGLRRTQPVDDAGSSIGMLSDLREGWKEFSSRQWLWVVVLQWAFLVLCFNAAHAVLGPVIAQEYLGGAGPWSWVLAGESVGDVLGVLLALRWQPHHPILAPVMATAATVWLPFLLLGWGPRWRSSLPRSYRWVPLSPCSVCCGTPPCNVKCRPQRSAE